MMDGCACVYVGDEDPPDFYNATMQTARVGHVCDECRKPIRPGDKYEKVAAVWEGQFGTVKTCGICVEIRESFFCDGFVHHAMWDMLREHLDELGGEVKGDCLTVLSPDARAVVCAVIEEIWADLEDD